ncbi:MAG: aldehyde dehydrogenase family protein [Flavobacteriaceae bacterium]|jgi:aldehyde dehydrogenase (NAD+)|nr:aldehyde dehydrogenase family protein [Flavobacteriaceae bacterium]
MKINNSKILYELNLEKQNPGSSTGKNWFSSSSLINSTSPINSSKIGSVTETNQKDYEKIILVAKKAFINFRKIPAPKRGDLVRQIGNAFREKKESLAKLVSLEMGKSFQEGMGEVQEMIDIFDFAVGLSRQLEGATLHSERPEHRMYEQYHPLGIIGIISAFNFPVAVWSWNVALAWICGNVCIWKPSEKTPLCGIACQKIVSEVLQKNKMPEGVSCLVNGDKKIGTLISRDIRIPLVSATGSTKMGREVAKMVGSRLGKSLLELGGNNAIIVTPDADIKLSTIAIAFGAVGTCGQRCTSTRRVIVHEKIYNEVKKALKNSYSQIRIGNPLDSKNHMGPLIDKEAVKNYLETLSEIENQGGKWLIKGGLLKEGEYKNGLYVKPCIAEIDHRAPIVQKETFAPILYLTKYSESIQNAIEIQNEVSQGLSSSIMTENFREAQIFLSHWGSDCGIANVNIGTSGAEIGGAFGGEKDTGGGRESGSDSWKIYMRRQTNTLNFSGELPLAQGIKFDL